MLVVICAIRKLMECIFTRRELRVLDDLLPESGPTRRQRGSFFNKIHRANWEEGEDEADGSSKKATRKLEEEEAERIVQEQKRQRTRTLGLELDDFSKTDMKAKAKQLNSALRYRSSSISNTAGGQTPILSLSPAPKFLIFVKLSTQEAFTPLNLGQKTVRGLLKRLQSKFPDDIRIGAVANVFQKTRKNLVFHLDDDMMDFLNPQQVFDIEISENGEQEGKINLTFVEIPDGF